MRRVVMSALLAGVLGVSVLGCEPGTTNAMKIGDHDVSRSALDGELAVLRDHPTMASAIAGLDPESAEFLDLAFRALRRTPVDLDPRYGTWNGSGGVTAPASPE
jgi:hypothetical protein